MKDSKPSYISHFLPWAIIRPTVHINFNGFEFNLIDPVSHHSRLHPLIFINTIVINHCNSNRVYNINLYIWHFPSRHIWPPSKLRDLRDIMNFKVTSCNQQLIIVTGQNDGWRCVGTKQPDYKATIRVAIKHKPILEYAKIIKIIEFWLFWYYKLQNV